MKNVPFGMWIAGCALAVSVSCTGAYARPLPSAKGVVKASWYGAAFKNKRTASGARFDPNALTGAHRSLPLGSHVRVTDVKEGRSVVVKIVDRGPYVGGRVIDLSYAAARLLGILKRGVAPVRIEPVADPAKPPLLVAQAAAPAAPFPGALSQ